MKTVLSMIFLDNTSVTVAQLNEIKRLVESAHSDAYVEVTTDALTWCIQTRWPGFLTWDDDGVIRAERPLSSPFSGRDIESRAKLDVAIGIPAELRDEVLHIVEAVIGG
jgi:hypothetical protein